MASENSADAYHSSFEERTESLSTKDVEEDDLDADSDLLIYLKSLILSLSAFVAGLIYFSAWLSTKNVFPIERDVARSAALKAYLSASESEAEEIKLFSQVREFLTQPPRLRISVCQNFSEYHCQNWFLLMTDRIDSYQTFLVDHKEYVDDYNFDCGEAGSLGVMDWEPLECPWTSIKMPDKISTDFQAKMEVCVHAALEDADYDDYDWGPNFYPYFVLGLCRMALHGSFMALLKELQAVCISGCGVNRSPDVNWSVLCLALSYYASIVRTAYGCTSSRAAAMTCEALRSDDLKAACLG